MKKKMIYDLALEYTKAQGIFTGRAIPPDICKKFSDYCKDFSELINEILQKIFQ